MTLEPWKVEESRVSYEDAWLKVVTDRCRGAGGKLLGDYHTLQYPDWVSVVALTAEGKVLLVREYRHARRSLMLGFPGGSLASPRETPRRAAERELMEETGHTASHFIELGKSAVNAATHSNLHWSFLALDARRAGEPSLDENEDLELEAPNFTEICWNLGRAGDGQALHLETLLLAVRFILADRSEELAATRQAVLAALTAPAGGDEGA